MSCREVLVDVIAGWCRIVRPKLSLRRAVSRARMLVLVASFWLASASAAQVPRTSPASPGAQIITAAEIAEAGIGRVSDLFKLADAWHGTSVQGFSWDVSVNALGTFGQPSWLLMVDGQVMDVRVFDAQNVNVLPLSLSEIDHVEVVNRPAWVAGQLAQHGVLHVRTINPESGVGIRVGAAAGNETGDPGPYRYTPLATPNIDRIGPTYDASATVAREHWHVRARFKADEHHATDPIIRPRVFALYVGVKQPRLIQTSGGFDVATAASRTGSHRLFVGFTRLQDLRFSEPVGVEVPTDHYFYRVGVAGDFSPGARDGISYRLSYTVNDLTLRSNSENLDFDWRQNALRGHAELRAATGPASGALGIAAEVIESLTAADLRDPTLAIPRLYARVGWDGSPRIRPELAAHLTMVEDETGYGVLATVASAPAVHQTVSLTGSIVRQPYAATNSLWFWTARGYDFLSRADADAFMPPDFSAATTYTVDAAWRIRPIDPLTITLLAGWRRFDDLTMPEYGFALDPVTTGFNTETTVLTGRSGQATTVGGAVRFRVVPSLEQRISYDYIRNASGDEAFSAAWRSQPAHRIRCTARFVPLPRMSLYARLSWFSDTRWPAYDEAAAASDGRYESTLPGALLLDLTAQKQFWKDHFDLSLSLRNLLNEAYRTHPAGTVMNMVLQIRARARLDGWSRSR